MWLIYNKIYALMGRKKRLNICWGFWEQEFCWGNNEREKWRM